MALTAVVLNRLHKTHQVATRVVNAQQMYGGGYSAINSRDHATAGSRGLSQAWASTAEQIPLGLAQRNVLGDTAATVPPESEVTIEDSIIESVTVTGATTIATQGATVYLSDDNTLTLTRPARGTPAGVITRYRTGSVNDVLLFGLSTLLAIAYGGHGQERECLGSMDFATLPAGLADIQTGLVMAYHGRLLTFSCMVDVAGAGAGATAAINLEIDGVNVTGGVLTITLANTVKGARIAATAITGAAVFGEGSVIDIEVAVGNVAFTAGRANLFLEIESLPGV